MKTYDIINPSDPYTFLAPDRQVAALTIFMLTPQFGATCLSHPGEDEDVPVFLFGGAQEWWDQTFESDWKVVLETRASEVAEALSSTLYGDADAREKFASEVAPMTDPLGLAAARKVWNEDRRTSLNDISAAAYANAEAIRKKFLTK